MRKRFIGSFLSLALVCLLFLTTATDADASYQSLRNPVVADNGVRELGVVFARFTADQLQKGDNVIFQLPADFIWTTAAPGSDGKAASAAVQTTADWNTTVVDDAYNIRYGTANYVAVPATYSGNANGLSKGTGKVLTFMRINDEEVKMEVTGAPTPGQECVFYIYFKRIYVPGGYEGEIPIRFDAPAGSGFAGGTAVNGRVYGSESKKDGVDEKPAPIDHEIQSIFVIGEKTFVLNGVEKAMDVAPYLKNDRTYLPVRYVARAMGVAEPNIKWNEAEKSVTLTKGETVVKMLIGSKVMYVNNKPLTMDAAPEIMEPGRTMLSLRWATEALGADVLWDADIQTVTLKLEQ